MKKYRMDVREFLNLKGHQMGAHVIARVGYSDPNERRSYPELTFEISDCNRIINLDFDVQKGGRRNSLRKIDILIRVLTEFRMALREEIDIEKKREKLP